jgi:Flp pilus assembly pilin Flp
VIGLRRLIADESGSTAVEYGLIVGVFVLCLFGVATALKEAQAAAFRGQHDRLKRWQAP